MRNRMKRHGCAPGNYPVTSIVPGTHGTQKTNVSWGNWKDLATNLAALTTSAYSSSGVLQGHEPPTSATLSIGLTTWPHWPLPPGYVSRRGGDSNLVLLAVNMLLTKHRPRYFVRRGSITAAILGWRLSTQFAGRQLYGCVGVLGGGG